MCFISYAALRLYPEVCASFPMQFYDRVLRSVLHFLCSFTTVSGGVCFISYAFLRLYPEVCASFPVQLYDRILRYVLHFLCSFMTVS